LATKRLKTNKNQALSVFFDAFAMAKIEMRTAHDANGDEIQLPGPKWHSDLAEAIANTQPNPLPDNYPNYLKDRFNHLLRIAHDTEKNEFGYYEEQWNPLLEFSKGKLHFEELPFQVFFSPKKISRFQLWHEPHYGNIIPLQDGFIFKSGGLSINCKNPKVESHLTMPRRNLPWLEISYTSNGKKELGYFSISDDMGGLKSNQLLEKFVKSKKSL